MRRQTLAAAGAAAIAVGGLLVGAAPAVAAGTSTAPVVVVNALNNPRQLAWADAGRHQLLVAEAGRGGSNCMNGPEGLTCWGTTGSVSLVLYPQLRNNSAPDRIVKGLLSGAAENGSGAVGSDGVTARGLNTIYVPITFAPPGVAGHSQAGELLRIHAGVIHNAGNVSGVEFAQNPAGGPIDTNPYGALALPDGRVLVADAASNDIIAVRDGHASVFAVLPPHGCGGHATPMCDREPTPTSLALGPDGNVYVGELAHEEPGAARVWKLSPWGAILGWRGGFSTVTGIAFGPDGALYVSQLFAGGTSGPPGLLTRVVGNTRTDMAVPLPAGVAVDWDGNVFVSVWSLATAEGVSFGPGTPRVTGQIWKVHF